MGHAAATEGSWSSRADAIIHLLTRSGMPGKSCSSQGHVLICKRLGLS